MKELVARGIISKSCSLLLSDKELKFDDLDI